MNYKYLGEAIALLGIAYSVFRWVIRNAPDADRPGSARIEIDLARLRGPKAPEEGERRDDHRATQPTQAPDPGMLEGAAAMFGITTSALIAMDPRERALLLSGYRAARDAERRAVPRPPSGG